LKILNPDLQIMDCNFAYQELKIKGLKIKRLKIMDCKLVRISNPELQKLQIAKSLLVSFFKNIRIENFF
jgi:hypothetical protein